MRRTDSMLWWKLTLNPRKNDFVFTAGHITLHREPGLAMHAIRVLDEKAVDAKAIPVRNRLCDKAALPSSFVPLAINVRTGHKADLCRPSLGLT